MMSIEDKKILENFAKQVRLHFTDARIWAFGSRARGHAAWDSDFDICIVLEQVDSKKDKIIRSIAWEIGFENNRVITTILFDAAQFEHGPMSESTLVANILQGGIAA